MPKRKKRSKGMGHRKGSAFERKIAKLVVKAFSEFGICQQDCWRSVLSGGHEISAGDLVMSQKLESIFPWVVECKFHKKVEWWKFHYHNPYPKWKEVQWMEQVNQALIKRKKSAEIQKLPYFSKLKPVLVMKTNHGPIIAMVPKPRKIESNETIYNGIFMTFKDFLKIAIGTAKLEQRKRK